MPNLLQETRDAIADSGHTESDIVFIGSEESGHQCSWDEFCALAEFEYDAGFGAPEIAQDLIFVFSDGTKLWRGEYDGSEWWEYSTPFKRPEATLPIRHLHCDGWQSLAQINK